MSVIIVSLKGQEIAILEATANEQMEKEKEKMPEGTGLSSIKRIAASTVAGQIIRDALPRVEIETTKAKKKRENK